MKLNGEVLYKRYGKRKFLGKGNSSVMKADSPNVTKESTWKPRNWLRSKSYKNAL